MASVFYYLTQTYGRVTTIRFFRAVREPYLRAITLTHYSTSGYGSARRERGLGLVPRTGAIRSSRSERRDQSGRRQVDVVRCVDRRHFRSLRGEDQQRSRVRSQAGHVYRLIAQWPLISISRSRTCLQLLFCPTSTHSSRVENFLASLQTSVGQALQYFQEKVIFQFLC